MLFEEDSVNFFLNLFLLNVYTSNNALISFIGVQLKLLWIVDIVEPYFSFKHSWITYKCSWGRIWLPK